MKITVERTVVKQTQLPKGSFKYSPPSDLSNKPSFSRKTPSRKIKAHGVGVVLKREVGGRPSKRNSRPETPLLRWKFDEGNEESSSVEVKSSPKAGVHTGRRVKDAVSARNLAAGLWRLHLPQFQNNGGQRLRPQSGDAHVRAPKHGHLMDKVHASPGRALVHSTHSMPGSKNGHLYKFESSFQHSNSAMEGVTKWDPVGSEIKKIFVESKHLELQVSAVQVISALETELEQARARINELETDRRSSKKKVELFLQKLSEERAAWRSREHEKIRAIIDDMKADSSREKKNRQRLEMINSKLVNELTDAKLVAKCYKQEYEKERKARDLIEEVCDELAKEIGEDRAEVEAIKRESMKLEEEVEEERKMLQMAEVWREERVHLKLVDAKVMVEEKYSQMNNLAAVLKSLLNSRCTTSDMEEMTKAESLLQAVNSVNIQDIRELTYESQNPDDFFSVFEEVNFGKPDRKAETSAGHSPDSNAASAKIHRASPEVKMHDKDHAHLRSNMSMDQSGELEEDDSEWETVTHAEDQGSCYSLDGSDPSISKSFQVCNISRNGMELEMNRRGEMEIGEAGRMPTRNSRKSSSVSRQGRLYPSNGGTCNILSSAEMKGTHLNGVNMSSDHDLGKNGLSPDLAGQWSSPDAENPQVSRGMKGCIEWSRVAQRSSLKARLLEARMESQKTQLRQVLKQKI